MSTINQRAEDVAHCAECGSEDVRYVTAAEFAWWQQVWRLVLRLHRPGYACMAWCESCYATDAHRWPHTMLWRLPSEPGRTWAALDVLTNETDPGEPVGCCGCGGRHGTAVFAVWGPDGGPADAEGWCPRCFHAHGPHRPWNPGVTYALVGPACTWEDWETTSAVAFGDRVPVEVA